jgi:hypothetical protein
MAERIGHESSLNQVGIAKDIETRLWEAEIAYGPENDPGLWKISPRYFVLRRHSFDQITKQAAMIPRIISAINLIDDTSWDPDTPYYFRFDATIDHKGRVVPLEFQNEVPVEDATVDTNRIIYEDLVSMPSGCTNPFTGSVSAIARSLESNGDKSGGLAIVVPGTREYYLRDYRKTAEMLRGYGSNAWVEEKGLELNGNGLQGTNGRINTVYRAFTRRDLLEEGFNGNGIIKKAYESDQVNIFPQFSYALEDKGVMASLFMPEFREKLIDALGGEEEYEFIRNQFPFTWLCDPANPPLIDGKKMGWGSHLMGEEARKEGYVIKPRRSFGSAGMFISPELSLPRWRESVLQALTDSNSGYILQKYTEPKRFWADILEEDRIVRTDANLGVRLSVTCIVEKGESEISEIDACLSRGFRIHGTRESVLMPVVIKNGFQKND